MDIYMLFVYILAGLVGLCVGSFLNVVIYRVPQKMSLATPASHCPKCGYKLKWYDNIPILSYCILGGKCRSCKEHISFRYTAVEILNAVLWLACAMLFWEESIPYACIAALACSVGICIAFIDLEHMLIYDRFQLILLALGAAAIFFDSGTKWHSHLIGMGLGFVSFFLLAWVGKKIWKYDALGGGDVKLAAVLGLLLGWEKLLLAVLIASVLASVVLIIVRHARGDEKNTEYPFGPFLVLGMTVALLFGNQIINWYTGILIG